MKVIGTAIHKQSGLAVQVLEHGQVRRWDGTRWVSFKRFRPGVNPRDWYEGLSGEQWLKGVLPPGPHELLRMILDEGSLATDGCVCDPDGCCVHGCPSWLRVYLLV